MVKITKLDRFINGLLLEPLSEEELLAQAQEREMEREKERAIYRKMPLWQKVAEPILCVLVVLIALNIFIPWIEILFR